MAKHKMLEHPGEEVTFQLKVLVKVTEAVLIEISDGGRLLNSSPGSRWPWVEKVAESCVLPTLFEYKNDRSRSVNKMNQLLNSSSMVVWSWSVHLGIYTFLVPLADFHCIISLPTLNVLETILTSVQI